MRKIFNTEGACIPKFHYMVNIHDRLEEIKELVDGGAYFTINRARQYGKTTTLTALRKQTVSNELCQQLRRLISDEDKICDLGTLFFILSDWCAESEKPIVLLIDEVDSAANNQVFLDFLAQFRGYYIHRETRPAFQSVILAGVYDIKQIRRKIRPEDAHKENSPWNIAADFNVAMSLSKNGIAGMLTEYEKDCHTGMDIENMAALLFEYTSGYPYLVSRLCKLMDEQMIKKEAFKDPSAVWTKSGFLEAVKILLTEKNALFESLVNKLNDYTELKQIVYAILFLGKEIPYTSLNKSIEIAVTFGFVKNDHNKTVIANRVFETVLYNLFLSEEFMNSQLYDST